MKKKLVIDSLELARNKFPGGSNSLDALCKRFNIDLSKRTKHNALLDCQLLREVYINLLDAREPKFNLSTKDLDRAIEDGPGLRWSLMGTFLTFHLAGGELGMKHMLDQFGPALKLPWTKLKSPKLNKELKQKIINGTAIQSKKLSINKLSNIRDNFLIDLIELKKKYKL